MRSRSSLLRALGLAAGYLFCLWFTRLVFLTITAFIVVRARESLQKVEDFIRANQVLTYGTAALLFSVSLQALSPLTRTKLKQIFDFQALKHCFAPNALGGLVLALVFMMGGLVSGHIRWLGIYMSFDEVAMSVATALLFAGCFLVISVVEEYILRRAIEPELEKQFNGTVAMAATSLLLLFFKAMQFDLSWIECLNFLLLSLTLHRVARTERSHMASASFLATYFILLHPFLGLPFLEQDMPGILLLRSSTNDSLAVFLSGGARGPENGIVMTVLLAIYLYIPLIRSKNFVQK